MNPTANLRAIGVLDALREMAAVEIGATLGREQVAELVQYVDALRDELNTEHPYRELWEAAEEELGRLRTTPVQSPLGDGSERGTHTASESSSKD